MRFYELIPFEKFGEFVMWLDRRSRRSLRAVVPQTRELLANPRAVLKRSSVVIPPFLPRGGVVGGTLILTVIVWGWGYVGVMAALGWPSVLDVSPVLGIALLPAFLAMPLYSWLLLARLLIGGSMELSLDGVRFV